MTLAFAWNENQSIIWVKLTLELHSSHLFRAFVEWCENVEMRKWALSHFSREHLKHPLRVTFVVIMYHLCHRSKKTWINHFQRSYRPSSSLFFQSSSSSSSRSFNTTPQGIINICSWLIHLIEIHLTFFSDDLCFVFAISSTPLRPQDTSNENSYSIFRRTFNALRHSITRKRYRHRPPDKFTGDDKFSVAQQQSTTSNQQQQQQQLNGNPSDGLHSWLSFDPSLPSYYRVI